MYTFLRVAQLLRISISYTSCKKFKVLDILDEESLKVEASKGPLFVQFFAPVLLSFIVFL